MCLYGSCEEDGCSNPAQRSAFGERLHRSDTTMALEGDPLILYGTAGSQPLFRVGNEEISAPYDLRGYNPPPDSVVEIETLDQFSFGDSSRVVIEALKPGKDEVKIWAWPIDSYTCPTEEISVTINVEE